MALKHSPSVVKDGLVMYYDMYNRRHSWRGEPSSNQLPTNISLSIYNNYPNDIHSTLVKTDETYEGSPIWRQTITPVTTQGVSWLTAQNNPGIGVLHPGGGGSANQQIGFSICYRPRVAMSPVPMMSSYSNIPGYGQLPVDHNRNLPYRDGWWRCLVVWSDTVTRTDAKYWAVNPRSAVLNSPLEVDWTLPFLEIRSNSNSVSAPVFTSRATNQCLMDIVGTHRFNITSLSYSIAGDFSFNGTTDSMTVSEFNLGNGTSPWTISAWVKPERFSTALGAEAIFSNAASGPVFSALSVIEGCIAYWVYQGQWNLYKGTRYLIDGQHHHLTWVNNANGSMQMYVDGELDVTVPNVVISPGVNNLINIIGSSWAGRFMGRIPVAMRYTRALSVTEIKQNYLVHKDLVG